MGDAFIATGTNQQISAAECGIDNFIYDMGKGLTLSFYQLEQGPDTMQSSDLAVIGFGTTDQTGIVRIISGLQTASVTTDHHGGSWLTIGGAPNVGGMVHFVNDPAANLQAHIVVS
jgi:hypothetical protein